MTENIQKNSISSQTADRLIAAHDGDVALLYIYRLRTGCTDLEQAARELCRTLREIETADEKLKRILGYSPAVPAQSEARAEQSTAPERTAIPAPAEELPEYRAEDILRRSREDGEFAAIIAEAARVMGRNLSSVDMKTLFGVYDFLGLPADVIMLLVNYVGQQYHERYGSQRRPSARAFEKEAYRWANSEIMTMEQAEEYIRRADERRGVLAEVKDALGIKGRALTKTENDYVCSWLDMGYGVEVIAEAYDRTVTNTGSLRWSYMNKIILSWNEKKLYSLRDVLEKDSRRAARTVQSKERGSKPSDFDELDKLIDKI